VNVTNASNVVPLDNAMQSQNVVPQVSVPISSADAEPKFAQNLGQVETKVSLPLELQVDHPASSSHTQTTLPSTTPKLLVESPQVVPVQQIPTVIVRPPTAPKSYAGTTSYKAYKEYFERLSICNGWISNLVKAQNLLINLDGATAEAV